MQISQDCDAVERNLTNRITVEMHCLHCYNNVLDLLFTYGRLFKT